MPGDSFVSKFWFNSKNGTKFGQSSYEEMNKAIFVYYPAKQILNAAPWSCTYEAPFDVCNSSMAVRSLASVNESERVFGLTPPQCSAKATITASAGSVRSTSSGFASFHSMLPVATVLVSVVFLLF
jgi:hypothetical protein